MPRRFWVSGSEIAGGPDIYQPEPGFFPLQSLEGTSSVDATILRLIVDVSVFVSYNVDRMGEPTLGDWWWGLQPTVAAGVMTAGGLDYPDAYSDTSPTPTLTGTLFPKYYESTWPTAAYSVVYTGARFDSKGERKSPTPDVAPAAGLSVRFQNPEVINNDEDLLNPSWGIQWYFRALFSDPS